MTIPGDTSKSFKRDKYVFKGWGTKPGKADVVYKDGSKVALQDKDITLYAQWQEVHENFVETGGIGLPIAIAGGVSANSGLRDGIAEAGRRRGWRTFLPEFKFTTDNAAMIAMAGYYRYREGEFASLDVSPVARLEEL